MHTPQDLRRITGDKPDVRLQAMLARPENWSPQELDAARAELLERGIHPSATLPLQ
jgi:hypothetical protein